MVIIEKKEERCHGKKVEDEKKSFVDMTKESVGRQRDALWLQVGERGLRNKEKGLSRCLVGRWGTGSVRELELQSVRKWREHSWYIRK